MQEAENYEKFELLTILKPYKNVFNLEIAWLFYRKYNSPETGRGNRHFEVLLTINSPPSFHYLFVALYLLPSL